MTVFHTLSIMINLFLLLITGDVIFMDVEIAFLYVMDVKWTSKQSFVFIGLSLSLSLSLYLSHSYSIQR